MKDHGGPILVVCAHPDDETIGAGIAMSLWGPHRVTLLHLTDGSPRDLNDARMHGFADHDAYLHERRRELYAAVDIVGIANFLSFFEHTGVWRRHLRASEYGDPARDAEFLREVGAWIAAGQIKYREDIVDGLEHAPAAFIGMLHGKNFGKLMVRVGPDNVS